MDALSVREFSQYSLDYDIVFSPIYLNITKKLFIVNSVLTREEKTLLRKRVMQELHGYTPAEINWDSILSIIKKHANVNDEQTLIKDLKFYFTEDPISKNYQKEQMEKPNLSDLVTSENITILQSVHSWEEAIWTACIPLLKKNAITSNYVQAMLEHRYNESAYIVLGDCVAIPHAHPEDGVNHVSMSLLKLAEPINFNDNSRISLIFIIAAIDKDQHLKALLQLASLSENKKDLEQMKLLKKEEDIHYILKQYVE